MNQKFKTSDVNTPTLLAGLSRSGTTWVGKLLDSHPEVLYRHEPDSWCKKTLNRVPLICDQSEINENLEIMKEFIDSIPLINASKVAGKQPLFPKAYLSSKELLLYRATVNASKYVSRLIKNFPAYVHPVQNKKYRLVWKSIDALGRINLIAESSANTKILHLIRHPCGYVASIIRGSRKGRFESSVAIYDDENIIRMLVDTQYAKCNDVEVEHILSCNTIEKLAWIWLLFNEKARSDGEKVESYKLINYQDLCASPIEELKKIYGYVGLSWNQQTEEFINSSTTINNDEYYGIVKDPLIASLKWKTELSKSEISSILDIVATSKVGQLFLPA